MAALISHKAQSTAPEALEKAFREWLGDLRVLQEAGPLGLDGESCETLLPSQDIIPTACGAI